MIIIRTSENQILFTMLRTIFQIAPIQCYIISEISELLSKSPINSNNISKNQNCYQNPQLIRIFTDNYKLYSSVIIQNLSNDVSVEF